MPKIVLLLVILWGTAGWPVQAEEDSLQALLDRSDLVVVATPQTVCGFCMSEGPIPNGLTPTPNYSTFYPELKVVRVLKGTLPPDQILRILFTALTYGPKDPPKPLEMGQPVFQVKGKAKVEEAGLPGSPEKGKTYVFFLENRKWREPQSYAAMGTEEIFYQNFNDQSGMVVASDAVILKLQKLAAHK